MIGHNNSNDFSAIYLNIDVTSVKDLSVQNLVVHPLMYDGV